MKTARKKTSTGTVLAAALTWDGSRVPFQDLSVPARKFLGDAARRLPDYQSLGALFAQDGVCEIRICWVPRLGGGDNVLAAPFPAPHRLRLGFQIEATETFGEVLGVIYRKKEQ